MSTTQKAWWYGVQLPSRVLEGCSEGHDSPLFTCKKPIGGKSVVIYSANDKDQPVRAFIGTTHRRGRRNYVLHNPKEVSPNQLRELDIHRV